MRFTAIRVRSAALWCAVLLSLVSAAARAENWPTYQYDTARSAVSPETLSLPLAAHWTYQPPAGPAPGWADPQPVPVEGYLELPRVKFDDAFHVAVADGRLYFGSSADNKVYCLDARTGQVRWTFFTGGPVRLAPTLCDGHVYVGSDDGFVYCLHAATGLLVWKARGGPAAEEPVIGHGRVISLWPIRTGVLVDQGVAYFAAGIFPGERIYVRAVRADTGAPVWTNNTVTDRAAGRDGFSPQGYLLASATTLFVPCGRNMPAAFNRADGKFLFQSTGSWRSVGIVGGTYALLAGETLYSGTEEQVAAVEPATGKVGSEWFTARRMVVAGGITYTLAPGGITAIDQAGHPEASRQLKAAQGRRTALVALRPKPADLQARLQKADQEIAAARKVVDACTKWTLAQPGLDTIVVAGGTLFAGGAGQVVAVDRATGEQRWQGKVEGAAKGLAVSDGRLFVTTDRGAIHCFGAGAAPPGAARGAVRSANPFPDDAPGRFCAEAAAAILRKTGITRGYCLVLGCETGRLAYELARKSDLRVYVADPDARKVDAARRALDRAGLYGSRVTIAQAPYDALPYPDYFAHLVVSEEAALAGRVSAAPAEVLRVLKPCGGALLVGQPDREPRGMPVLNEERLRDWFATGEFPGGGVARSAGVWASFTRGPLEGASDWTHQYGDAGNRASSDDTLVKCPLGVLWYGEPGPDKVPGRHEGNAAPLVVNGRFYLEGRDRVMCYDAYNGYPYWERKIPGAYRVGMVRECSNLAADDGGVFVAAGTQCLRLDGRTGATVATYAMPPMPGEARAKWAYVAISENLLYGSVGVDPQFSRVLFAVDRATGALRWKHDGRRIRNNTIAISDGRICFADDRATPEQRQEALRKQIEELKATKGLDAAAAEKELKSADVRVVVALDAGTGAPAWEKPVDLTDCGMHVLSAMASKGVLLFCGSHPNGHYWPEFLKGEYAARRATALAIADGSLLWSKALGYRIRPLVVGDTLYAEPWAFDLRTGEQRMRANAITGLPSVWEFERPGHHCGTISGSPNALFFRSGSAGYYDLVSEHGTEHFSGQRPGCWINMIPANGLVVMPEASSGCICLFSIHCTTVFRPRQQNRAWGMYSDRAPATPVKRLAVNLGAPGDRTDAQGNLWLSHPRPSGRMQLTFPVAVRGTPDGGFFNTAAEEIPVQGTDTPWIYASGHAGLLQCSLPLAKPGDGAAVYTVRLSFADMENTAEGQRVFDIKVQGQTVATAFDIVREAGGPKRAVVREFRGIPVEDVLNVELVPAAPSPTRTQAPLLNAIEVVRERVLHVGLRAPSFVLSNDAGEQAGAVAVSNHTDREFAGTLRLEAPRGFAVTPADSAIRLAPGESREVELRAGIGAPSERGTFPVRVRLLRADGTVEAERESSIEYLGERRRVVIKASSDAYVSAGTPAGNFGPSASLLVDGGASKMGDESHNIAYLRFPLEFRGKLVSAVLRIHTTPSQASESGNSGTIHQVAGAWDENALAFGTRPTPGAEVGVLGRVGHNVWEERPLKVDLTGLKELSLALVPTSTDGASYVSREGSDGPELVIEYLPE